MSAKGRGGGGPDPGLLAEAVDRIAHQIKNPLQAVSMNLEVVRMRVRQEAPELWSELERYAGAVDENVRLLDRRLRLLLALGRRSREDPAEPVDVPELVEDLVGALRLDEERPPLRVEASEATLSARARPGFLLELVLDVHRWAAREAPDATELPVRVGSSSGEVTLTIALPADAAARPGADHRERWRSLGARAGGKAEGGESRLRLHLPAD